MDDHDDNVTPIQQTSSSSAQQLYCPLYALAGQPDECRKERCAWWTTENVGDGKLDMCGLKRAMLRNW
jgi:hypothetical protein